MRRRRGSAGSVLAGIAAAVWVLATPGAAVAETGYAWFEPQAAAPGTRIEVRVDSYNCDGWAAERLPMRMFREFGQPLDAILDLVRHGDPGSFRFTVPRLDPGTYWIELECSPGEWLGVGVGGEGGAEQFRVLPPETAALPPDADAVGAPLLRVLLPIAVLAVVLVPVAWLVLPRKTARDRRRSGDAEWPWLERP